MSLIIDLTIFRPVNAVKSSCREDQSVIDFNGNLILIVGIQKNSFCQVIYVIDVPNEFLGDIKAITRPSEYIVFTRAKCEMEAVRITRAR